MFRRNSLIRLFLMVSLALIGNDFAIFGQDTSNTIENVSISSPTAASLGKYGDFPISYNTGIPQISIPIYTVKAGSLSLPVSLSYHASGLKVQEYASWVGAGWALNAGGVITRMVVGAADDRGVQNFNWTSNGYYSDSGYNSYLFVPWNGLGTETYDGKQPDDVFFTNGYKDGEPDLYFFNFGHYTGKFYFNDDQTPIFVPEEDFKVQPDLNNGLGGVGFQGFIVTTPDGVKYYFGMTGNDNKAVPPIEISVPSNTTDGPGGSDMAVSSWYLNKIISPDGIDSITFTYAKEQYSEYTLSMSSMYSSSAEWMDPNSYNAYGLIKTFIQGVRLTGITFPNGQITFTPAVAPRTDLAGYSNQGFYDEANALAGNDTLPSYPLGSIEITNKTGFCKKDSLYTSYFHDNINALNGSLSTMGAFNITSDTYRLRLDSIQETSCDATAKIPPYRFTYYPELVPRKLSFGIDHWGFYNGVTNNQGLIPTYFMTQGTGYPVMAYTGANRDASWPAMRGGALQKITYPTGGYTHLVFQANDTWCSYNTYTPTEIQGWSVGYDGSTTTTGTYTSPSTSNTFQIIITNNLSSGRGVFTMTNATTGANGVTLDGIPGQNDTAYFFLSPNTTYNINFADNSSQGAGYGLAANIMEMVPTAVQSNVTVGGLRIDTLTSSDGLTADSITKVYTYTSNGGTQSSGILYSRPVYIQIVRNNAYGWVIQPFTGSPGCTNAGVGTPSFLISAASVTPMEQVQGNHIGYNEVDVTQVGNGKSVYRYYGSNYWDYIIGDVCTRGLTNMTCSSSIPSYPFAPLPFDPMRGELQSESYFNQQGQELKEIDYTPLYVFDSLVTPACKYATLSDFQGYTGYVLQSARKVQTTTVTMIADPTTSQQVNTTSTVYYGSNYHHQPTRKVTSTSTSDSLITNIEYPPDFRIGTCDAIADSLPWYINTVDADSVQLFDHLDTCAASGITCRLDTLANFRRRVNLARNQFVRYRRRSFFGPLSLQGSCYLTAQNTADTALKPVLRLQAENFIVPIENSTWQDVSLLHSTYSKFDTSLSPVGVAYPGRTQLINLQSPSTTLSEAIVSGSTIVKDNRYLDETLHQFSGGRLQQVTPHSGVTTAYVWDYLTQEPIAKAINAAASQIAYTSFEADGSGSWTIPSSLRDNSAAITGGYSYNLINGAITRSGLISSATYIVSYWSKSGSSYSVTGNAGYIQGKTINGWTYFEHTVTGVSTVTITGSADIDELRLYPSGAQMTTYTYTPLIGMTSQCDVENRISYFFYDALGRLRYAKDQDGNILKTIEYHYMNQ